MSNSVPSSAGSSVFEFFRYHGVWAPGVRLFRSIGFQAKATIIALTFAVPIGALGWSYYGDKADAIAFSAKERMGVNYARALLPLLPVMQAQRLAAAAGQPPAPDALREPLAKLAAVEKADGADLGTARAYAALLEADAALARSPGLDGHDARMQAALDLLTASTDGSNLTLDPDIDTYYLMDASMARLPAIIDSTGRVQAQGLKLLAGATPADVQKAVGQHVMTASNLAAMVAGLDKAIAYNGALKSQVDVGAARTAVESFLRQAAGTVLRPEGVQGDAAAHQASAQAAMDASLVLAQHATDQLDRLIDERVARMERSRWATTAVLVAAVLAVLYLFVSFRKVLEGGLREVAFHIDAMAAGNLTTVPSAWGADEAARLMSTLRSMQLSLTTMVSQVRTAADVIAQSSSEIAAGAHDLSARTEQSAASLQESAAAMEEIAATVRQTASVTQDATRLAADNLRAAERGGQIIGTMMQTMDGIHASSTKIGEITATIDGIAFQTNILALNAAVEAARAGEAGRGFAVVATEVRALAQRSAGAAREIKELIGASVQQVSEGSNVVRDAGGAIDEIMGKTRAVDGVLGQIHTGADEQARGVAQSSQAVHELDTATQQNAALVEQTAAAASSLRSQADALVAQVARFRLPEGAPA